MSICLIFHLAWLSDTLCRSSVSFYRVHSSHQVLSKHLNKFRQSCVLVPEVSSLHVTTFSRTACERRTARVPPDLSSTWTGGTRPRGDLVEPTRSRAGGPEEGRSLCK